MEFDLQQHENSSDSSVQGGRRFSARIRKQLEQRKPNDDNDQTMSDLEEQFVSRKKKPKVNQRRKETLMIVDENGDIQLAPVRSNNAIEPGVFECGSEVVEGKEKISNSSSVDVVEKSDYAKVKETIRIFNKHYLHFVQEEEQRCKKAEADLQKIRKGSKDKKGDAGSEDVKRSSKRPDLKAVSKASLHLIMLTLLFMIIGVDVGHQFYSRAEMVAIGFHSHWLNGIDYMGASYKKLEYKNCTFPVAVSIVLSGQYEDDLDNSEDVVYTGQGGHDLLGHKRQVADQVLLRGNLALKNNIEQCVPVRVIRGHGSASSYCGKIYTYDGLYNVVQYWAEKGASGFTIFKYRLKRLEGQPTLTTNQVQFIRAHVPQSLADIRGLVCEDISGGQEDIPIVATNLVDDPAVAPMGYSYTKSVQVAESVKLPTNATGCKCRGSCTDPKTCSCARLNGSDFPYASKDGGRLIEAKPVVFECGPSCGCGPGCVNRTSQRGLKYRLEVFRTPKKGWAVRSWDFIPSGAPVCEYTGRLMRTDELDNESENNFIFEIDCLQTIKGLDGRERRQGDVSILTSTHLNEADDKKSESVPDFCIDAGSIGNIARFINHSCAPNLFVQCVLSSHHDIKLARVMLFAADNIPPLQELTYDYGYALDSVMGQDGTIKKMPCYCGAADCRKRLY
ncbi:SET domain [Macleaya cordata]|uniref:SET domain n=1 Tax=Macleaya cordata TaxID=56857 RepID=A0A200QGN5_MACCD|nr:SET domain [Macleaya cordata]